MGRTLDVLLGRTTKQTARLKSLLGLTTKRIAVARAHRQVRRAQARGDVEQLLRLGHRDRALLRAEQVVREQDFLDVLDTLEAYCALVADRAELVDDAHGRECPEELQEAAAGLVYAAARCGDLPELQEVRALLAAKFGRGFASAAAELRSGCGIDTKIVQKLSTKQPSLESRRMVLLEIGAEKGIPVRLHSPSSYDEPGYNSHGQRTNNQDDERRHTTPQGDDDTERDNVVPANPALAFKDVEAAAQAAFESAATAAAAAKAAIELSRAGSGGPDDRYRRHTGDEMLHGGGGEDLADAKKFERGGDIAENEPRHGEQRVPARTRPASVRTHRGR